MRGDVRCGCFESPHLKDAVEILEVEYSGVGERKAALRTNILKLLMNEDF